MLRILRSGQRWLTAIFIVGVGGVFVLFLGLQGPMRGASPSTVVRVGSYEFGPREFERVRARRESAIQAELGDAYDARVMSDSLDNLASRELVDRGLLALAGQRLGLTVSKREIENLVLAEPGFRGEGGRFDRKAFERYTAYEYGSQRAFLDEQRVQVLALKMLRVLTEQPEVSEAEARDAVREQLAAVRIATVVIDPQATDAPDPKITPEAIQAALKNREDEIANLYAELAARYQRPEQVRARHILRRLPPNATEEEVQKARAVLEKAKKRIEAGEDFADVARELSQDPGSKSRGGDLGFFGRGQMAPAFEAAAFALQPGEMSGIVRTDFGLHLIRVEERREAVNRPLADVREEVAEELLRRDARQKAARAEAETLTAAVRAGKSLEDAAREAGIDIQRSGWLTQNPGGFVPGLGAAPELLATAFALKAGETAPRVFEVGGKLALVELLETREPSEKEVDSRVKAKRAELLESKRNTRASAWIDQERKQLVASGDLMVNLDAVRSR